MSVDEGLVPGEQDGGEVEVGGVEDKLQDLPPCRGLDIVCGKGTDFNYGPWADRQRYTSCEVNVANGIIRYLWGQDKTTLKEV